KPSSVKGPRLLAEDGSNLPTTLARIQTEDPLAFHCLAIDLGSLVPDMLDVRVVKNIASNEYDIWVDMADGRSFPAQVLSDGTLRLLALATLRNDPQFHGTLCLEEPENGVQPLYMKKMARLLREMATNFNDAEQKDEPFKQVL